MFLKEHLFNLSKVTTELPHVIAIDDVAHKIDSLNISKTQEEQKSEFLLIANTLSIFRTIIDEEGITHFIFARPYDTSLYYISCVNFVENNAMRADKVIFQLILDEEA